MRKKFFYGWIIVIATILLNSLGIGLFSSIISLFFTPITEVHGFSQAQVAAISAFATIGGLLAAGALGKLYQTKSTRRLVLVFGILQALTFVALSIVNSLIMIYVVSLFMGFATLGATALSAPGLITKWFKERRGFAMGLSMAGAGFGPGIMAPVITTTIEANGYRQGFIVLAAMIVVFIIIAFLLIRDKPEDMGLQAYGLNPGDRHDKETHEVSDASEINYTLKEATKTKMFLPMVLWTVTAGFVVNGVLLQIPSFYSHIGFSGEWIGTLVGVYAIMAGLFKIVIGQMYDKAGPVKANYIFYSAMILAFVSLMMTQTSNTFVYAYVLFAGIGMGVNIVAVPLLVSHVFGSKNYATIYPVFMLLLSVGGMIGAIGTGMIVDNAGFQPLFTVAVAGGILQLLLAQTTVIMKKRNTAACISSMGER